MGLSNLFSKRLILALLVLWAGAASAQTDVTKIPKKLRIGEVLRAPANGDMMLTLDTFGNVKKDTIPAGGSGTHATGTNGLNGTDVIGLGINPLNQNTVINTSTFNFSINGSVAPVINKSTGSGNVFLLQNAGSIIGEFVTDGVYYGQGISNYPNVRAAAFVNTSPTGTFITRDIADANPILTVRGINSGGTAPLTLFQNSTRGVYQINWDGRVTQTTQVGASAGQGTASTIGGSLRPTANGDVLIGLSVTPQLGSSSISSVNTLVGGTGYPNGTGIMTGTGGTGVDVSFTATVTSGIVTSVTLLNPGVDYTVGNVIALHSSSGTGATVTVSAINSYTGVSKLSAKFSNAPIMLTTTSTPSTLLDGMVWQDGINIFARINGTTYQLAVISGNYSTTASATTTFTVTIGSTQPNNSYKVQVTPTSVVASSGGYYVTNKTTTTFQVVYPASLTGLVSFDWLVSK